ncbi:MAG: DUF6586 family protein [Cellvibrio sp.]|uniref:DUF6586 family protein n=1 Tax=Cellvibrio sp. TaxID=1965322 RepID=UPI0031B034EA
MSINHLQLVNQKLAFASSIIASLVADTSTDSSLLQKALKDSVVFHLATALHFYVRELAEHQRIVNMQSINSVSDLASTLKELDKYSSEVSELVELEQLSSSWLNQLTRYYEQLLSSPAKEKEKKAFGQENIINVVELADADEIAMLNLTTDVLSAWASSFRSLIARQRETSAEY